MYKHMFRIYVNFCKNISIVKVDIVFQHTLFKHSELSVNKSFFIVSIAHFNFEKGGYCLK